MKKLIAILILSAIFASCNTPKNIWYPAPIKHGGPCPENAGYSGYSNH